MGKLLDMADKYDSIQDEPLPKLYVDEGDVMDDEDTLVMKRPTTTYPGVGLALVIIISAIFWGATIAHFFP
jgi:hypothetical protein